MSRKRKNKRVGVCLVTGLFLMSVAGSVNAVPIAGLDWLPFRYTLGLSWNDVQPMLEPGSILEGWRYATRAEIKSLYTALHPGWVGDEWSAANKGITDAVGLALGYTTYNPDTEFRMIDAIAWPSGGASLVSNYRIIIWDRYAPPDTEFAGLGEAITKGSSTAYGRPVASFLVRDIVADHDGDGVPDDEDAFPDDPTEWADTDGDGVGDNGDAFPEDPDEWADADGDGVGDNSDAFPEDPDEWADADGDGVGNNSDAFPEDPEEWADTDGDGVGDNADQNDSSDLRETVVVGGSETGVPNHVDAAGLSIQDHINEIEAEEYRSHGQYVSTVAHLVEDLLDAGVITQAQADIMMSCAARSGIGKKKN